jgi:hypothetical protein
METKIWTEYYDWLTWQKKHKHLNLNIDEAVNAYKKEFRLWEESERVRLVNEQLYRLYTEGHTTSAAGGGGEPSGLDSLLSFRFAGVDLANLYGRNDEITTWPETQNRATLTKIGAGSVTVGQSLNSAIIVGDGAHLGILNSTNPLLNPFISNRATTIIWHGVVTSDTLTFGQDAAIYNFEDLVNSSKFDFQAKNDVGGGNDLISLASAYINVNSTPVPLTISEALPFASIAGVALTIILQVDLQNIGVVKFIVNSDSTSTVGINTLSVLGASVSPNPINFRLGIGRTGASAAPSNQEIFEIRAYDKILTNAEINTVISELNSLYGTGITGV